MSDFYDYRLKFSKNGPIRFVGHLDVMRYIQKANRRAALPVRYSEGFSPHQILSFALPLSVGATSDGEYLDMSLMERVEPSEIVRRLNQVMHEGIEARACILLPEHAPKAMTVVAAARYRLRIRGDVSVAALYAYLAQTQLPAVKKTKRGETTIDLKPLVHEFAVADDGTLDVLLHAGSRDHVKPALLYEGFFAAHGQTFSPQMLHIHRVDLYVERDGGGFTPLIPGTE